MHCASSCFMGNTSVQHFAFLTINAFQNKSILLPVNTFWEYIMGQKLSEKGQ